jgi:uncharacterized delta-60 repeat protein
MKKTRIFYFLLSLLPILGVAQNPGDFDPSFAIVGHRTEISPDTVIAQTLHLMQDGRIVAAGRSRNGGGHIRIHLYRYLPDGSLDTTFATTGEMIASGPYVDSDDFDFEVQSDGKIILYYYMYPQSVDEALVIGRLNTDGTMDATFGNSGWVIDSSQTAIGYPNQVVVQTDGKIIVTGSYVNDTSYVEGFFAQRMLPNGMIDGSYGSGGVAKVPISFQGFITRKAMLQPDGKLLFMGNARDSIVFAEYEDVVGRLLVNGQPDPVFGVNGIRIATHLGFYGGAYGMGLGPQGEIYLMGDNPNAILNAEALLLKLDSSGNIDANFGNAGWFAVRGNNYDLYGNSLKVQPDGKIVMALEGDDPFATQRTFNVARVLPAGAMDTGFGNGGITNPSLPYGYNGAFALDLQADGKIVAVGVSENSFREAHLTVARYLGGNTTALNSPLQVAHSLLFPNPSNGNTTLRFELQASDVVNVSVVDLMGRNVFSLLENEHLEAGMQEHALNLATVPNGSYLVRVQTSTETTTLRMNVVH